MAPGIDQGLIALFISWPLLTSVTNDGFMYDVPPFPPSELDGELPPLMPDPPPPPSYPPPPPGHVLAVDMDVAVVVRLTSPLNKLGPQ